MKNKHGFTLVELLVIVIVIAVLASLALVSYAVVQRNANDSKRSGSATIISEALEKYYDKNGEYPSVRGIVNNFAENTGSAVATKLDINETSLVLPGMTGTNTLSSTTASQTNNYINYTAKRAVNDTSCQTVAAGGCDEYTLTYVEESGDTITVTSRHRIP